MLPRLMRKRRIKASAAERGIGGMTESQEARVPYEMPSSALTWSGFPTCASR